VIFERENSFVKQILIYLKNRQYEMAVDLSGEFTERFPDALISHYLLAKSHYKIEKFQNALKEAHKAFNLAESKEDMVAVGVFLACAYYELRRYKKGYEVLKTIRDLDDPRIEKAMFILSLCTNDPKTAMIHVDTLYKINKKVAGQFVDRFISLANDTIESPGK
jgi:tetratricopeptide (TPR) repeat protein